MNIAIYGYGNLGKGVYAAAKNAKDASIVGIVTRRSPESVKVPEGVAVYSANDLPAFRDKIDVLLVCGGSATDLPVLTPALAEDFNVVDSFDTHAKIPEHFDNVNKAAVKSGHIALISAGWDPGLFSLARVYASAVLPDCKDYTFWGRGISQGHSDAIRRIEGVLDARQYTVPIEEAMQAVKEGKEPTLSTREKHKRECYVVAEEGADLDRIEKEIKTMPNYFADYDTTVTFISAEELKKNHAGMPHGGSVLCTGKTGLNGENQHFIGYTLALDSNPEFTASVLLAYARAVNKMYKRGITGAKTVLDIAPSDLSPLSEEELRAHYL